MNGIQKLLVGIDIGSTTTKIVAVNPEDREIVYSDYRRHNAKQVQSLQQALQQFAPHFPAWRTGCEDRNFHPGANHDIEDYLEKIGFEIIEARMTDVIRKTYFYQNAQNREYKK